MFHTLITLAYTIPGLYLFLRIWSLFIERRHRVKYIFVFALIFSLYPLSNLVGDSGSGVVARVLETITNYLLPFFLYLFLLVLLTDILLLVNRLIKVVPKEKIKEQRFRYRILFSVILLAALVVVGGIINFNTIRTTTYNIEIPKRGSDAEKLRIAFVSDLHLEDGVPESFLKKFVQKANGLNPDVVLLGGDIVEGGRMGERMVSFEKILHELKPVYGVYGVLGNHDGYGRGNVEAFFSRAGIKILQDTTVVISNNFIIAGRHDTRSQWRKTAEELMRGITEDLPVILLDHRPTDYEAIEKTGADIVMSGHTHHGQLFPINLITAGIYELSYGHLSKGTTNFFVSSGLRLWGPPVRTIAKSEIVVVEVTFR